MKDIAVWLITRACIAYLCLMILAMCLIMLPFAAISFIFEAICPPKKRGYNYPWD
jgi:hypothetical protein